NSLLNDIKHARQKLDQYNKQLHLLPTINDLKQSKEELKKLPKEINFPESGIERLEKNKEALVPLLSNHTNIEKNISIYQNKLDRLLNNIQHDRQKLDQYNKQQHLIPTINDIKQ